MNFILISRLFFIFTWKQKAQKKNRATLCVYTIFSLNSPSFWFDKSGLFVEEIHFNRNYILWWLLNSKFLRKMNEYNMAIIYNFTGCHFFGLNNFSQRFSDFTSKPIQMDLFVFFLNLDGFVEMNFWVICSLHFLLFFFTESVKINNSSQTKCRWILKSNINIKPSQMTVWKWLNAVTK